MLIHVSCWMLLQHWSVFVHGFPKPNMNRANICQVNLLIIELITRPSKSVNHYLYPSTGPGKPSKRPHTPPYQPFRKTCFIDSPPLVLFVLLYVIDVILAVIGWFIDVILSLIGGRWQSGRRVRLDHNDLNVCFVPIWRWQETVHWSLLPLNHTALTYISSNDYLFLGCKNTDTWMLDPLSFQITRP